MWNLAKICVAAAICIATASGTGASSGPGPGSPRGEGFRPFAGLAVPKTPLCFGAVSGLEPRRLKASTTARVLANRPFGVLASFDGLTLNGGPAAIPAQQLTVKINGKKVPLGTERVQIASGGPTSPYGAEVPIEIEIEVQGIGFNPAGRYGGNLVLSII